MILSRSILIGSLSLFASASLITIASEIESPKWTEGVGLTMFRAKVLRDKLVPPHYDDGTTSPFDKLTVKLGTEGNHIVPKGDQDLQNTRPPKNTAANMSWRVPPSLNCQAERGEPPLQFLGYYASAMNKTGPVNDALRGNYTSEIADHANLTWVADDNDMRIRPKLQIARDSGVRAVVDLQSVFFGKSILPIHSSALELVKRRDREEEGRPKTQPEVGVNQDEVVQDQDILIPESQRALYQDTFRKFAEKHLADFIFPGGDINPTRFEPTILGFVFLDEPYVNGKTHNIGPSKKLSTYPAVMKANLEFLSDVVRSALTSMRKERGLGEDFPTPKHAVIFNLTALVNGDYRFGETGEFQPPRNFDWYSFAKYECWERCEGAGIPQGLANLADSLYQLNKTDPKGSPFTNKRRIFLTSDASILTQVTDRKKVELANRAKDYFRLALEEPCVVGVLGFLWQNFDDRRDAGIGLRDEQLKLTRDVYRAAGRCVKNPNNNSFSSLRNCMTDPQGLNLSQNYFVPPEKEEKPEEGEGGGPGEGGGW